MEYYILKQTMRQDYDLFLFCLTTESFFDYLCCIENEPAIKDSEGVLLIDQLLVTGDAENRYISCAYNHGHIELNTARYTVPDNYYKNLAADILQNNKNIVESSILTSHQKEYILTGTIF